MNYTLQSDVLHRQIGRLDRILDIDRTDRPFDGTDNMKHRALVIFKQIRFQALMDDRSDVFKNKEMMNLALEQMTAIIADVEAQDYLKAYMQMDILMIAATEYYV